MYKHTNVYKIMSERVLVHITAKPAKNHHINNHYSSFAIHHRIFAHFPPIQRTNRGYYLYQTNC